jgi:ABC-type phosphate/phosphonate transport system substrate-binding protein
MSPDRVRIAALPMYDFPELVPAHDALWAAIADRLRAAGIDTVPETLTRTEDLLSLWRDPGLVLGQTCGYPLMTTLAGRARVVATPIYRAPGCTGAFHRSAIIVAAGNDATDLTALRGRRCAVNGWDSNTGMNLLRAMVAPLAGGSRFFGSIMVSGSHRRSVELIAAGDADLAAIDAVTLALLTRIDPALVAATRLLVWSPSSPCLPMVTAAGTDTRSIEALRRALADIAADPALSPIRDALMLDGFERLGVDAYTPVLGFERRAVSLGYPHLI